MEVRREAAASDSSLYLGSRWQIGPVANSFFHGLLSESLLIASLTKWFCQSVLGTYCVKPIFVCGICGVCLTEWLHSWDSNNGVVCERVSLVHTLRHVSGRLRIMHQNNITSQIVKRINTWNQPIISIKCPVPFWEPKKKKGFSFLSTVSAG